MLFREASVKIWVKHFFHMLKSPDNFFLKKNSYAFYFINTVNTETFLLYYGHQEALSEICCSMIEIQLYQL